jgi:hypothetical protein
MCKLKKISVVMFWTPVLKGGEGRQKEGAIGGNGRKRMGRKER